MCRDRECILEYFSTQDFYNEQIGTVFFLRLYSGRELKSLPGGKFSMRENGCS